MDYEKKYNEALEMAKYYHDRDNIQFLENIFPELKESEDERIRQRIIHALHGDVLEMSEIKEAIDWLEKQGTPSKLSEEEQNRFAKGVLTSCALSFIDYLDAHKHEGKMCVSNGECEDIENAFHNAMWDKLHRYYGKYIERQGEKPQGKSALEAAKEEKVDNANKVEPKPWSEEDEREIEHCIDFLNHPDMIRTTPTVVKGCKNWLESLRPRSQWKPSDEQIGALEHFVRSIAESGFASPYDSNTKLVYSLLNDLKKLKL